MRKSGTVELVLSAIALVAILTRGTLADKSAAVKALEVQGYADIEVTDHAWLAVGLRGCDGKDAARFIARAANPRGDRVQLYVCTGWPFKGATIRVK